MQGLSFLLHLIWGEVHFTATTLGKCTGRERGRGREGEGGKERGKGEVAASELMALGSVDLNASSASVLLRSGCTLESPGCPDQLDEHFHKGGDLSSGIFQSFPDASNVQPGGTQCLPEAKERTAAESSCDQVR